MCSARPYTNEERATDRTEPNPLAGGPEPRFPSPPPIPEPSLSGLGERKSGLPLRCGRLLRLFCPLLPGRYFTARIRRGSPRAPSPGTREQACAVFTLSARGSYQRSISIISIITAVRNDSRSRSVARVLYPSHGKSNAVRSE